MVDNGDTMELIKARFDLARINRERFVFFTPQEREQVMDWLNKQQKEIERLKGENEMLCSYINELKEQREKQRLQIERLKSKDQVIQFGDNPTV